MSSETQNVYNFPPQVSGTTLAAIQFQVLSPTVPPTDDLSSVSCVFKKDGAVTLTAATTINNANNWIFTVGPVAAAGMTLEEGIHEYDIKTTDAAGKVRKYVRGEIQILPSQQ